MKPTVLISAVTLALAAAASNAGATQINQHAAGAFQPYNGADAPYISYYYGTGVRNTHTTANKAVIGGLVYNPGVSQLVNIYGYNATTTATTACTISVYDMFGVLIESSSFSVTGASGDWWRQMEFTSIPRYGVMSAYCALPPNGDGRIFGYTVGA